MLRGGVLRVSLACRGKRKLVFLRGSAYSVAMSDFPPVLKTALWMAGVRARESTKPNGLVSDPLAHVLIGQEGLEAALALEQAHPAPRALVRRMRLTDDLVLRLVKERSIQTVIMAGTGLDTRPYRLELPAALEWIELDYPVVTNWKNERLHAQQPRCTVERVGVDLSRPGAFASAVAERCKGRRSLVIMENVFHYLDLQEASTLLRDTHALGPGTLITADLPSPRFRKSHIGRRMLAEMESRKVHIGRATVANVDQFAATLQLRVLERYPIVCLNDDPHTWRNLKCPWWISKARRELLQVVVMECV